MLVADTESPALITPSVRADKETVLLPTLPLLAYRNCPLVSDVGVAALIVGTLAVSFPFWAQR